MATSTSGMGCGLADVVKEVAAASTSGAAGDEVILVEEAWNSVIAVLLGPDNSSPSTAPRALQLMMLAKKVIEMVSSTLETFLFCKSFPPQPFLNFFFTHGFPRLFTDTSEHIRFLLFSFPVFHFLVVGSVR